MKIAVKRIKPFWIITVVSGLVFFLLLGFRLGLFQGSNNGAKSVKPLTFEKESWMVIFQMQLLRLP